MSHTTGRATDQATGQAMSQKNLEMEDEIKDFRALYLKQQSFVRQVLFRLLGEMGLDDAVQDCFLKIWKARESFRSDANVRTWIYRIAVNHAYDLLKSRPPEVLTDPNSFNEQASAESEETLVRAERDEIHLAVLSLPVEFRAVLVAFVFEEMSLKEVSHALDIPEGTVKSRLSRGREQLKEILTKKGYGNG